MQTKDYRCIWMWTYLGASSPSLERQVFVMEVATILEQVKSVVGIDGEVRLEFKPYKTRGASIDLSRRVLAVNSRLLDLGEDVVKYLVLHELVHLKLGTSRHDARFQELVDHYAKVLGIDRAECEAKITKRILEINGLTRQTRQRREKLVRLLH